MAVVDFAELKALVPAGRLMALDVGTKTIGIATSDALRMLATPLTTLKRGKLAVDLAALAELAKKHEIKALAIGLPLNMDGTEGPRCQSVRQFATNIANHGPPALADAARRLPGRAIEHRRRHPRHDRRLRHEPRQTRRARGRGSSGVDPGECAGAAEVILGILKLPPPWGRGWGRGRCRRQSTRCPLT